MKVIKNNHSAFVFPLKVTCRFCKSILEVDRVDIKEMPADTVRGEPGYKYVVCPLCKDKTTVKPKAPKK